MATDSMTRTNSVMIKEDLIVSCMFNNCGACQSCKNKKQKENLCCVCDKFGPGRITDRCCYWCTCDNKDKRIIK